jgi:hypothetical protein
MLPVRNMICAKSRGNPCNFPDPGAQRFCGTHRTDPSGPASQVATWRIFQLFALFMARLERYMTQRDVKDTA